MVKTKITPKIRQFITDNRTTASRPLSNLIWDKFQIRISYVTVQKVLDEARAEKAQENEAKVEAVRSAVLDDANRYAGKYLAILDREIDAWDKLITSGKQTFPLSEGETEPREIIVEGVKDRATASQSLQKCISSVLEFAKPPMEANVNVSIKPDLSKLSPDELRQLRSIKSKLERDRSSVGEAKLP